MQSFGSAEGKDNRVLTKYSNHTDSKQQKTDRKPLPLPLLEAGQSQ